MTIDKIIDNIFIGSCQDAIQYGNIYNDIFTVAHDCEFKGSYFYPLIDGKNDDDNYKILVQAIECLGLVRYNRKEGNILVHCVHGVSRSPAVVSGYMIDKGYSYDNAIAYITEIRLHTRIAIMKLLKRYDGDDKNKLK